MDAARQRLADHDIVSHELARKVRESGRTAGVAFVTYSEPGQAKDAIAGCCASLNEPPKCERAHLPLCTSNPITLQLVMHPMSACPDADPVATYSDQASTIETMRGWSSMAAAYQPSGHQNPQT